MKWIAATALAVLFGLTAFEARAQSACPEGRTASGQCVDPELASGMRQNSVIYSQPKISYTHYPILPSLDLSLRYPNSLIPPPQTVSPTGTAIIIPAR